MTEIPTPQYPPDIRQVVKGISEDGTLVYEQVGFEDLSFRAVFGSFVTSGTEHTTSYGTKTFVLAYEDEHLNPGCQIQITSRTNPECFMYGLVTQKLASPDRINVAVSLISNIIGTFADWEIQVISGPQLGVESDTTAVSGTQVTLGFGAKTFTIQSGKFFPETASVLVRDLNTAGNYLYGTVTSYSGSTLLVEIINTAGSGTSSSWAIRLLDGPGALDVDSADDWGSITEAASGSTSGPEDYKFITLSATSSDDYEAITDAAASSADYEAII